MKQLSDSHNQFYTRYQGKLCRYATRAWFWTAHRSLQMFLFLKCWYCQLEECFRLHANTYLLSSIPSVLFVLSVTGKITPEPRNSEFTLKCNWIQITQIQDKDSNQSRSFQKLQHSFVRLSPTNTACFTKNSPLVYVILQCLKMIRIKKQRTSFCIMFSLKSGYGFSFLDCSVVQVCACAMHYGWSVFSVPCWVFSAGVLGLCCLCGLRECICMAGGVGHYTRGSCVHVSHEWDKHCGCCCVQFLSNMKALSSAKLDPATIR